jgi:hypothetical protein
MKKNYFIIGLLAFSCTAAFAQRKVGNTIKTNENAQIVNLMLQTEAVNDTMGPSVLPGCNTTPTLLGSVNGGYVAGTNGYGDKEKAQALITVGAGDIYSALVFFGAKNSAAGTSNFQAKIYDAEPAGPTTLKGTSANVAYNAIDTTGFTQFPFTTPVPYTEDFFVSVVVENGAATDTIGIYHTGDMCGGGTAWEKWSDDTWVAFNDATAWGFDPVLFIFAEVDEVSGFAVNEHLIQRGSHKVYPNPSKNEAHLIYSLINEAKEVSVSVTSVNGQVIAVYPQGSQNSGLHGLDLNVSQFAAGTYLYTITTDGQTTQGKFIVSE